MVSGSKRLQRKLSRLPKSVQKEVRKATATGATEMVQTARGFVPKDEGYLRDSIRWRWIRKAAFTALVTAGNERTRVKGRNGKLFQNAFNQEFGTKNMPANPFFFVAYRLRRTRIRSRISRAFSKAIRIAFK
ncbi:MAG: HK97-gp10 family putative phage morphogenesis protein [Pseudomonadota bacterium]